MSKLPSVIHRIRTAATRKFGEEGDDWRWAQMEPQFGEVKVVKNNIFSSAVFVLRAEGAVIDISVDNIEMQLERINTSIEEYLEALIDISVDDIEMQERIYISMEEHLAKREK